MRRAIMLPVATLLLVACMPRLLPEPVAGAVRERGALRRGSCLVEACTAHYTVGESDLIVRSRAARMSEHEALGTSRPLVDRAAISALGGLVRALGAGTINYRYGRANRTVSDERRALTLHCTQQWVEEDTVVRRGGVDSVFTARLAQGERCTLTTGTDTTTRWRLGRGFHPSPDSLAVVMDSLQRTWHTERWTDRRIDLERVATDAGTPAARYTLTQAFPPHLQIAPPTRYRVSRADGTPLGLLVTQGQHMALDALPAATEDERTVLRLVLVLLAHQP